MRMDPITIKKTTTSLTIGAFIVVSITGMLLFFDLAAGSIRATHEWMSLLFVLSGLLHVYSHKKALFNYFSNKYLIIIFTVLLSGGLLFISSFNDIYASGAAYKKLINAKLEHLAPIFNANAQEIDVKLKNMGLTLKSRDQSLNDVAIANGMDVHDIIESLLR